MDANEVMAKTMKKIGIRMGLIMNTFNTIIFSTIGTLSSGHFSWKMWFIGAVIGWITGAIITTIIPPKKVQDWVLNKANTTPETFKGRILASLATNMIVMPVMTIVMGLCMPLMSAKGIERSIAQTEKELAALQQQQSALVAQRDELQGKYDAMQIEIDDLQVKIDEAKSPGEAEPLKGELEGKKAALAEMESGINEMQGGINEMQGGIDGMTKSIEERQNAVTGIKKSLPKTLPLSALLMTCIGIVLGFIFQPIFMKLVMRSVLGKDAPQ